MRIEDNKPLAADVNQSRRFPCAEDPRDGIEGGSRHLGYVLPGYWEVDPHATLILASSLLRNSGTMWRTQSLTKGTGQVELRLADYGTDPPNSPECAYTWPGAIRAVHVSLNFVLNIP